MGSFTITIAYDSKNNTSNMKVEREGDISIPEVIGVIESAKLTFLTDKSGFSKEEHEKMEKKS